MRREAEFWQWCCQNCKKKYNVSGERENWISIMRLPKFLSCSYCQACPCPKCMLGGALKMETNCGNDIVENGREKKEKKWKKKRIILATKLPKIEGKKKDAMSTTFFTTNYRRLVVIGSNLNLTLRLLFCPNNNNQ